MKFEFNRGNGTDLKVWSSTNRRLMEDLLALEKDESINAREVVSYVQDLLAELRPIDTEHTDLLFLMYDSPAGMESDARDDFIYRPSYIAAAFAMTAAELFPEVRAIPELEEKLPKLLKAITGRKFEGHGYELNEGFLSTMDIFAHSLTLQFIAWNDDVCPEFSTEMTGAIAKLVGGFCTGEYRDPWTNENYIARSEELRSLFKQAPGSTDLQLLLDMQFEEDENSLVFVYGTLMRGRRRNDLLEDAEYLGTGRISDFEMYDLGSYPAIVPGCGTVMGEVYRVDKRQLKRLDTYEGRGVLYEREHVLVSMDDGSEELLAEAYVYMPELERRNEDRVWEYMQPYGSSAGESIWYAAYGSNMCRERFMKYINGVPGALGSRRNGCFDKTPPAADIAFPMHYELYYGNESGTWQGGGVAFIDKDRHDNTLGRAWLITRGQLRDIHRQECWSYNWYDTVVCLGDRDGVPVFTITNHTRRKKNEPSDEYMAVIERGRRETGY